MRCAASAAAAAADSLSALSAPVRALFVSTICTSGLSDAGLLFGGLVPPPSALPPASARRRRSSERLRAAVGGDGPAPSALAGAGLSAAASSPAASAPDGTALFFFRGASGCAFSFIIAGASSAGGSRGASAAGAAAGAASSASAGASGPASEVVFLLAVGIVLGGVWRACSGVLTDTSILMVWFRGLDADRQG